MNKMKPGDYIRIKNIPDQETLDRIRACVKKMGYQVGSFFGEKLSKCADYTILKLYVDGDLVFATVSDKYVHTGKEYTPQQIFAMVEKTNMNDVEQTVARMESEIVLLKKQLADHKKVQTVTYKCGDRFIRDTGEEYILADVTGAERSKMALINLTSGNRWRSPKKINNPLYVTQEEIDTLTGGVIGFQPMKSVKVVTEEYTLTLDKAERDWLRGLLQNPVYGENLDDEDPDDLMMRKSLWDVLE